MVHLEEVVRLDNSNDVSQIKYKELLPRIRNGKSTIDDWKFLLSREATPVNLEDFKDATRLFYEKGAVYQFNNEQLANLKMPIVPFIAHNSKLSAKKAKVDDFRGLCKEIYISINANVNVTFNLWVKKGLVNGSPGIVRDIIYNEGANILNELPNTVIIEFECYTGMPFFND